MLDQGTYSSIPESASQFNGLQQHGFSFLEAQVATQAKAEAHSTEARRGKLGAAKGKRLDHFVFRRRFESRDS